MTCIWSNISSRHGYIVAAPDYPLSSRAAYTHISFADPSDVTEQTRDIKFIITRLLADPVFGPAIDPAKIGTTGHSLGAVTSYFSSFGAQTRDPRIAATALIAGGDPVQTALSQKWACRALAMPRCGCRCCSCPPITMFLPAPPVGPIAAYSRVEAPQDRSAGARRRPCLVPRWQ